MNSISIPTDFSGVTDDWLTSVLASTGMLGKASVSSHTFRPIGEGKGFAGQIALFDLAYTQISEAPSSLVCKLPPPALFSNPGPDMVRGVGQIFSNEIRFYRGLSGQVSLRTPCFYYGDFDLDTGHAVLLIEHVADAQVGDIIAGPSPRQTQLAIENLAAFHAVFWETPRLSDLEWLTSMDNDPEDVAGLYCRRWEQYVDKHAAYCPPTIMDLGSRLQKRLPDILCELKTGPKTFLHGDYHVYNMLFRNADHDLCIIDWQRPLKGPGLWDFAYFMSLCVGTETRRRSEATLLETYHSLLVESGVSGYSFAQCTHDYRLALVRVWMAMVIDSAVVDFSNPHAQAIRDVVFPRRNTILIENSIMELLE